MNRDLNITGMPPDLSYQERANWLARQNFHNIHTLDAMNLERWRKVITFDVRAGTLGGLLQGASLFKLFGDQTKALTNEKFDASARLGMGIVALIGTTADVIGTFIYQKAILAAGTSIGVKKGLYTAIGGRTLGMGASLCLAWLDMEKADASAKEGQEGLMWLYNLSAVFGVALSGAMLCLSLMGAAIAVPVIGALIAIVIIIAVAIEYHKDNPLQDWLERTPWGSMPAERYPDFATLDAQLKLALKE